MRIFLDTANVEDVAKHFLTGLIDGVTTNPTLIRNSGKNPTDVYKELSQIGVRDISMEVYGSAKEMYESGKRLAHDFHGVATIKLTMTRCGLLACKELSKDHIRTNVTLVFTIPQAILAAKAGATYVSPFVGRLDDQQVSGLEVVRGIKGLFAAKQVETQVLAASIRNVHRAVRSFYNGADVVTMPPSVFENMYKHILTDAGLEIFEQDIAQIKCNSVNFIKEYQ
jgi:transaldolase